MALLGLIGWALLMGLGAALLVVAAAFVFQHWQVFLPIGVALVVAKQVLKRLRK